MRKPKRSPRNTRNKKGGYRPFVYLILTIVLIVLLFFLLKKEKKPEPVKPPAKPPVERPGIPIMRPEKPGLPEKIEKPEKPETAEKPEKPVKPAPVQKGYSAPSVALPVVKPPKVSGPGTIAIIIDDMGTNLREAKDLMDIGVPLTFSVIPGLREAKEVAEAVHGKGYDVMLHIPMEPQDYPRRRLEANGLLMAYSGNEIEQRMKGYLQIVPYAVGANNHMGSRFTEDRDKMRAVLEVLKEKRMFFVDSMTSPKSVGLSLSHELGLQAAARNAPFLDNSQDVSAIKLQLGALERMARKKGSAVGICHPHRATIQALTEELPLMRGRGIRFVYVSRLVR